MTDEDALYLVLPDNQFECRRVSMSWHLMRFTKAKSITEKEIPAHLPEDHPERARLDKVIGDANMSLFSILYDMSMNLLKPSERDRFCDYMETAELDNGVLETAIITAVNGASQSGDQGKAITDSSVLSS